MTAEVEQVQSVALPPVPARLEHVIHPLKHCPACDYSLEGLPRRYRCPECGEAYDDSMLEVATGATARARTIVFALTAVVLAALAFAAIRLIPMRGAIIPVIPIAVAAVCLVAAQLEYVMRRRRCIATPEGVRVGRPGRAPLHPWPRLAGVQVRSGWLGVSEIHLDMRLLGVSVKTRQALPIPARGTEARALARWLESCREKLGAGLE